MDSKSCCCGWVEMVVVSCPPRVIFRRFTISSNYCSFENRLLLIFKVRLMGKPQRATHPNSGWGGRPRWLQAHIVATLRLLTYALFCRTRSALPSGGDFAAHSRFHARSDFISSVFRKMLHNAIPCNFQTPGFFFLSRGACVCLFPRFLVSSSSSVFHDWSDGSFPSFSSQNISRILHRRCSLNALHGIFLKNAFANCCWPLL